MRLKEWVRSPFSIVRKILYIIHSVTDKVIVAKRSIKEGYCINLIFDFVGLAISTFNLGIRMKKRRVSCRSFSNAIFLLY